MKGHLNDLGLAVEVVMTRETDHTAVRTGHDGMIVADLVIHLVIHVIHLVNASAVDLEGDIRVFVVVERDTMSGTVELRHGQ